MKFPFAVTYTKPLRGLINKDNQQVALQHIKTKIAEKSADKIVVKKNKINYKGSTSYVRGNLFSMVNGGMFSLIEQNGKSYLVYEIRMRSLFIIAGIAGVFMGVASQLWWVGIIAFLWLGGMNFIINYTRHGILASEIAIGISDLFFEKEKEAEGPVKDESLKSWM